MYPSPIQVDQILTCLEMSRVFLHARLLASQDWWSHDLQLWEVQVGQGVVLWDIRGRLLGICWEISHWRLFWSTKYLMFVVNGKKTSPQEQDVSSNQEMSSFGTINLICPRLIPTYTMIYKGSDGATHRQHSSNITNSLSTHHTTLMEHFKGDVIFTPKAEWREWTWMNQGDWFTTCMSFAL